MKRLILIRHAKSSWDAPFDDHARTLNERGRRDAATIGAWLNTMGFIPDHIHSSDAARTRETSFLIGAELPAPPQVTWRTSLYHASPVTLWTELRQAKADTVAIIGHNPGIAFFAEDLVAQKPDHPRFLDYPTCATLVCDFEIEKWADAVSRSAHVRHFVVPKDLAD